MALMRRRRLAGAVAARPGTSDRHAGALVRDGRGWQQHRTGATGTSPVGAQTDHLRAWLDYLGINGPCCRTRPQWWSTPSQKEAYGERFACDLGKAVPYRRSEALHSEGETGAAG